MVKTYEKRIRSGKCPKGKPVNLYVGRADGREHYWVTAARQRVFDTRSLSAAEIYFKRLESGTVLLNL